MDGLSFHINLWIKPVKRRLSLLSRSLEAYFDEKLLSLLGIAQVWCSIESLKNKLFRHLMDISVS